MANDPRPILSLPAGVKPAGKDDLLRERPFLLGRCRVVQHDVGDVKFGTWIGVELNVVDAVGVAQWAAGAVQLSRMGHVHASLLPASLRQAGHGQAAVITVRQAVDLHAELVAALDPRTGR